MIPEKIRQSQFAKNVSVLATGTIIVQAISTLLSPVLSRLYTPIDYGLFAVFASCVNVLIVISCFRYEFAILIPKRNSEAVSILKLCIFVVGILSFLILVITVIFNSEIASLLGNENLSFWLYFISPVIFAAGIIQAFNCWFNRNQNYKIISGIRVLQSSFTSGFSLFFGFLKMNSFGLILSFLISQLVSSIYLLSKSSLKFKNVSFNFDELKAAARKYMEFPLYNLPSALIDTVSLNSIIFLLNHFFNDAVTGSYAFSLRLLSIPGVVIGASVGQVFFQKISEAYNNKTEITASIFKTWKSLFLIGIVPTFIIFFAGEELFTFVFGNNWAEAGRISSYLCLLTFISFISSPTSSAMLVLRKQKTILALNIAAFIYRPLSLMYGYWTNNFMNGIILYVIFEVCQIFIYNYIMIKEAREVDKQVIQGIQH